MKSNNLIKLFNRQKPTAGYTLIELLIGASISVVVIGAAGMGLMNLMRGNLAATNQTERRTEVNRALEFISDEVRRAETIELDPNNVSVIPNTELPTGFDSTKSKIVLALNVPENLGQGTAKADDRVIYYVGEKPTDGKWIGPNVIYRYGPPLDTSGGSYTNGTWKPQPLIDRVSDQTFTPSCSGAETTIAAQGFAACVNTASPKIARVYVNGKFSEKAGDEYQADIQVFARAEAENLNGNSSTVNFGITPPKISDSSSVKVLSSKMGCSQEPTDYDGNLGGTCDLKTTITQSNNTLLEIQPDDFGDQPKITINAQDPFTVTVKPSINNTKVTNPFPSYFDVDGVDQAGGEQNNQAEIKVEIDLQKNYLNENPVKILSNNFTPDQVKLLGDKSKLTDAEVKAWNLDGIDDASKQFEKLRTILDKKGYIDTDNEIKLEANQYLLVFEVGQKDTNHPGFDWQDQIVLITVE